MLLEADSVEMPFDAVEGGEPVAAEPTFEGKKARRWVVAFIASLGYAISLDFLLWLR